LELPTLNVRAAVEPVATHEGVLAVPENPASVGWWTGSALPGSASGNTVIDGHIDSAVRGIGALWHLSTLTAGEHIIVTTATRQVEYQVVALRVYPKDAGIPATVFATAGPPQLVLISCGGPFDADRGSYQDNIAVFATLI
jgi:sortase (surface protein transpeptidase)